jgi:hypothetical protein
MSTITNLFHSASSRLGVNEVKKDNPTPPSRTDAFSSLSSSLIPRLGPVQYNATFLSDQIPDRQLIVYFEQTW